MSSLRINKDKMLTIFLKKNTPMPGSVFSLSLSADNNPIVAEIQDRIALKQQVSLIILTEKKSDSNVLAQHLTLNDVYDIGTIAVISHFLPSSKHDIRLQLTAQADVKFKIDSLFFQEGIPYTKGEVIRDSDIPMTQDQEFDLVAKKGLIKSSLMKIQEFIGVPYFDNIMYALDDSNLLNLNQGINDLAFSFDQITAEDQYLLLSHNDVKSRIDEITKILARIENKLIIDFKAEQQMKKSQKEYILREQQKAISKELGDEDSSSDDFITRVSKISMPFDAAKIRDEEVKKLKSMSPQQAEYQVSKNYLEWLASIPWNTKSKDSINIKVAKDLLDNDHFGLDIVKKRVLEFLAVSKLKGSFKGQTLCLVGPPGVGKTSLAKSIAKAVSKKFIRVSLGGVHDEAEIRGHRRTFIGSMPGKIVQSLKKIEVNNPVILLDEIDKLGKSHHSDPGAAMLEVLDPEQNHSFMDHYINTPVDLSEVFFIATANDLSEIPAPLRDRMEIIHLSSYTLAEKKHIATNHLVKKQLKDLSLNEKNITFTEEAILKIIHSYTRESGVRDLQRKIGQICRYLAHEVVESKEKNKTFTVDEAKVKEVLGNEVVSHEKALANSEVGIVSGLAWTSVGGEMLFIEATKMQGHGNLVLTGSLGEVMKESAKIALSYIKANKDSMGLKNFNFDQTDIHLHFPSGATPKDGPSAGIAICSCLLSLLTGQKVNHTVAMTGEISLRGKVLPVGGIKEKVIAAHRAGIKTVLLPQDNLASSDEIPEEVKSELTINFVSTFEEVMKSIFEQK